MCKKKSVPHRRPVCGGRGTMPSGFYNLYGHLANTTYEVPCQSCDGSSIVWG